MTDYRDRNDSVFIREEEKEEQKKQMKKWQMANLLPFMGKKTDPDNRANLIARIDQ